ncbi:MAG: 3D-(3,5/4)-trihydroxycyclohexane-1,2-dione acylhydrolase (decyclizing) [Actinomycetia bacterium]|nr:3D-(3,5/4)-trihydroxycyclohexane-1,2-dione acylhydrolase (decyclizing) [Actinomycetes bacterium]
METIRLTTAEAIVRHLAAQRSVLGDGSEAPLFPGVFAIFGHGNVTSLGLALEAHQGVLPTWRGQNEQGMALAAIAYAKAMRRRQIMVATSSVGPGATNMVTAAGVAHANRLPLLLLAGDTFNSRLPDPVLQQVEHFHAPSTTVNDAFRPVSRYWDRITTPEQVLSSLPHAIQTMLDPADCGPAFVGLPQDVQAMAYDFPVAFFAERVHDITRPRASRAQLDAAARAIRGAAKPLIIAGGGVHYSFAEPELGQFAEAHNIPVVETVAGKASLLWDHPLNAGPIGVTGSTSANALAAEADVVIAVGCRLQDFTTGSWTVFRNEGVRVIGLNTARFDATKHSTLAVVGDARESLVELTMMVEGYRAADSWSDAAATETAQYHAYIDKIAAPEAASGTLPTYAQVVGAIDRVAGPDDFALSAAGGFPGEVNNGWRAKALNSFDCEYGFSCMGYELSGGWGAKMAMPDKEVVVFVGDGSYLMMNSDLYSSVLSGHKLIVVVCDNGGFAVINRLQVNQGGKPFNNLLADARIVDEVRVDFAAHARAMGCEAETVSSIDELDAAFARARDADRTYVITLQTDQYSWTEGGSFWEVGVPEVSERAEVQQARSELEAGLADQHRGW